MYKKTILLLSTTLCLFGINLPKIKDIATIPQNFESYSFEHNISFEKYQNNFKTKYFNPWEKDSNVSAQIFSFGEKYFKNKTHFGDNKQEITQSAKDKIVANADTEHYPSISRNGVTLRNTDCRLLPTAKQFFLDFKKESGGYPFDYMQNSMIHINTPIKVLHYSKDKSFVFVKAPYVAGWVSSNDVAFVSDDDINKIKDVKFITPIKDDITISDEDNFISKAYIGAIFWQDENNNIFVFKSDEKSKAVLRKITSFDGNKKETANIPQLPNKENLTKIATELYGQNYGWGGFLQNRDCSMMIRDFYTNFGIYLPRNSFDQANNNKEEIIELQGKTKEEKLKIIKEKAIPFATLFYMKGHIMMYVGTFNDEVVIFHAFWSIKTLNKGRFVIGGSFVTSLSPGIELAEFDHSNGTLLDKLISMRILGSK